MATPVPTPTPAPVAMNPWERYQAALASYRTAATPTPMAPYEQYGTPAPSSPAPTGPGLGAMIAMRTAMGGGGAAVPATPTLISATNLGAGASAPAAASGFAPPSLLAPEISTVAPSASAATSGGYAAALGGPGSLAYWAPPAAFLGAAYLAAPTIAKHGERLGKGIAKTLGLSKKRYERPYSAESALTSSVINRQAPGATKSILDALQGAKAIIVPGSSTPDFVAAEKTPDNATRIGIPRAYLTERERETLKSKYGKNYNFGAIKAGDLAAMLQAPGRTALGIERMNAIKDAVKELK